MSSDLHRTVYMSVTPQASQAHVTSGMYKRVSVALQATAETLRNTILRSPKAKYMYVSLDEKMDLLG